VAKLNFEKDLIKEHQCRKLILRKLKVDFEKPFKEPLVLELTTLVRDMR